MCKKVITGAIVGGVIAFLWYSLSWMVLPWHMTTLNGFTNEAAISQAIVANAPKSGMYFLPIQQTAAHTSSSPMVFASVHLEGLSSMTPGIFVQFLIQVITAGLLTWMLTKTTGLSYKGRLGFILIFALAAGIMGNLPYWNWFDFSNSYTLVQMADNLIAWLLAGLAIAKIVA